MYPNNLNKTRTTHNLIIYYSCVSLVQLLQQINSFYPIKIQYVFPSSQIHTYNVYIISLIWSMSRCVVVWVSGIHGTHKSKHFVVCWHTKRQTILKRNVSLFIRKKYISEIRMKYLYKSADLTGLNVILSRGKNKGEK